VTGEGKALPMPVSRLGVGLLVAALLGPAGYAAVVLAGPWRWIVPGALLAVVVLVVLAVLRRGTWLTGSVVSQRVLWWTRSVDLAAAERVSLASDRNGGVVLMAGRPRHGVIITALSWTDHLKTGLPEWACRDLAGALGSSTASGAAEAVQLLTAQADHLAAGGSLPSSPLAQLLRSGAGPRTGT